MDERLRAWTRAISVASCWSVCAWALGGRFFQAW
jgi:hypothetical protein